MTTPENGDTTQESGPATPRTPLKQALINAGCLVLLTFPLAGLLAGIFTKVDPQFVGESVGWIMLPAAAVVFTVTLIWCSGYRAVALACAGLAIGVAVIGVVMLVVAIRKPTKDFRVLASSEFDSVLVDGQSCWRHNGLGIGFETGDISLVQAKAGQPDEKSYAWIFLNLEEGATVFVYASRRMFSKEQSMRDFLSGFLQGMQNTANKQGAELTLGGESVAWSSAGGEATIRGTVGDAYLSVRMLSEDSTRLGFPLVVGIQVVARDETNVQAISRSLSLPDAEKAEEDEEVWESEE